MTLYKIFDWLELTFIGSTIRDSIWLFPVIESFHLIGLAILGGSILIVDFRLVGLGLNQLPIRQVALSCRPWFIFSLFLMFCTGIPLFLSEAIKCYYNPFFWIKIGTLLFAILLTFTLRAKITMNSGDLEKSNWTTRLIGIVSMCAWFTVAASGRWIGFY